ncbi:MAG: hypothetical protein M3Y87_04745 [Myxococcota bacterium]|nr:hypothetical protein [Myxococcota bacterium]
MITAEIRPQLRFAWRGASLFAIDPRGRAGAGDSLSGLWFRETRYLRTLRLRLNGREPHLCSLASPDPSRIELVYIHPELESFGGGGSGQSGDEETFDAHGVPHRAIDVRVVHQVRLDGLESRIALANRSAHRVRIDVRIELGADWADLLEALGDHEPEPRAPVRRIADGSSLELRLMHRALPYATHVEAPGADADRDGLTWSLELGPRAHATLAMRVIAVDFEDALAGEDIAAREDVLQAWWARQTAVEVRGRAGASVVVDSAIADLRSLPLLDGTRREWLALAAGMPLYPALFGRDALTAGWHASFLDRGAVLDATLTRLGRMQTDSFDDWTDEQPGRIPFQVRRGPQARLGENPFAAHYADFASPLMYVISLVQLFGWRGDERSVRSHLDTARRILDWAREHGDRDGDGYLEYLTRSPMGPKNQAWKDSGGAIVDARGRTVPAPIAACEIQGYWFAAQELFAILLWMIGQRDDARAYWDSATALKARFDRDFWMEDEGYYGLALDPDKRLVRSITSNVGHCLASGILEREKLPRVVERMFAPDLFGGWGIRTLSADHPSYAPLSYHTGSVWSVENATIAFGLRRFGFEHRAMELAEATFELASLFRGNRIPECVGGYSKDELSHPGAYPQANPTQAWNVSAIPMLLTAMLGLVPLAPIDVLIVDPALPPSIDRVQLRGLRVGGATIDLLAWRDADGRSHFDVANKQGTLHVVRQPAPESMSVGIGGRLRALWDGRRAIA